MGTKNPTPGSQVQNVDFSQLDFEELQQVQDALDAYDDGVIERADEEPMEFELLDTGNVAVTNLAHGEDEKHEHVYHVQLDDGAEPYWCVRRLPEDDEDDWEDCPAMKYHDGHCKHCHAVARNPAILAAVKAIKDS